MQFSGEVSQFQDSDAVRGDDAFRDRHSRFARYPRFELADGTILLNVRVSPSLSIRPPAFLKAARSLASLSCMLVLEVSESLRLDVLMRLRELIIFTR